jgi:hypothetical protein
MSLEQKIKPLINMFYYTDTAAVRFLAWMKARPSNHNIDFKNFLSKMKK